jgi:hypothetical protein
MQTQGQAQAIRYKTKRDTCLVVLICIALLLPTGFMSDLAARTANIEIMHAAPHR